MWSVADTFYTGSNKQLNDDCLLIISNVNIYIRQESLCENCQPLYAKLIRLQQSEAKSKALFLL